MADKVLTEDALDKATKGLVESIARKIGFWAPEAIPGNVAEYIRAAYSRGWTDGQRAQSGAVAAVAEQAVVEGGFPGGGMPGAAATQEEGEADRG